MHFQTRWPAPLLGRYPLLALQLWCSSVVRRLCLISMRCTALLKHAHAVDLRTENVLGKQILKHLSVMMVTECCCYIGVNWDGHKGKGVKSGHDLPWTADAGSNLYSQSMCPLLAGSSRPCPQGHPKYKKPVLGKGKILFCHHIRLKQKENLQRMTLSAGSTFSISLGCTARILCPETETFLRGQSNDLL